MRVIGIILTLIGLLAIVGETRDKAFPTSRWFFQTSREVPLLNSGWISPDLFGLRTDYEWIAAIDWLAAWGNIWNGWLDQASAAQVPWFGWLGSGALILVGLLIVARSLFGGTRDPITERRYRRFREIKRGYYSLVILLCLAGVAALDQALVGKRAIAVHYDGEWVFPAFEPEELTRAKFGDTGPDADAPQDYRELRRRFKASGEGRVFMPLIPYDATGDSLAPRSRAMVLRDGLYFEGGSREPYSGLVARYHDVHESKMHVRYTMRRGMLSGAADGWLPDGTAVYSARYVRGEITEERFFGEDSRDAFLALTEMDLRAVKYHPTAPARDDGDWRMSHWLGTTSQQQDVVAYLYGGLQVNFKAALIYLPIVYLIGMSVGLMMGYFGGWFDLIVQRLIEIFSNMPFLFVVIILSSMVPEAYKGLPVILSILILFGWMGMTYLMRTAAYRDKARDYIAATRVLGAGTPRILTRHLLPNTVAIIVTLVPFTMSSLVSSLTALDYLGFGLPADYATWGRLLRDGLSNLSSPWLVTTTFIALVSLLVLITFVGEAVREAFDPKKFTYYR